MKRLQFSIVVALLLAAVSVPAQRSPEVSGQRDVRRGVDAAREQVDVTPHGDRFSPTRVRSSRPVGSPGSQRGRHADSPTFGSGSHRGRTAGRHEHHPTPVRRTPERSHGYWKVVCEPVLVQPGHWHREYVPALYGWTLDACGHGVWEIVEPACYRRVWVPPRYENRHRRVWVCA